MSDNPQGLQYSATFFRFLIKSNFAVDFTIFKILLFISLILCPILIWLSLRKKRDVQNPINNKTYSIITMQILDWTTITLVMQELLNFALIMIAFSMNGTNESSRKEYVDENILFIKIVYLFILLNHCSLNMILFLQGYEWFVMCSILQFQKDKSFGEIFFEI